MKKYDYIDALRGVAVLLVIFVHFGQSLPETWTFVAISKYGQYGVQLFFVLSAYTLCHSIARITNFGKIDYLAFMTKRFFRIAPLYYFAIPAYFLFTYFCVELLGTSRFTDLDQYSVLKIVANLAFVHGLYPPANNNIVPGGWSIGCEFLFYAIFPIVFLQSRKKKSVLGYWGILSVICTLGLIITRWKLGKEGTVEIDNQSFIYFSIFNQFGCFLMGVLYFYYSELRKFKLIIFVSAPVSVALIIPLYHWKWGALFTPMLASVISLLMMFSLRSIQINTAIKKIGQLSFSIYICHFMLVWIFHYGFGKIPVEYQTEMNAFLGLFVVVAITVSISYVTNRFIENPFINLGRKLSEKMKDLQSLEDAPRETAEDSTVSASTGKLAR